MVRGFQGGLIERGEQRNMKVRLFFETFHLITRRLKRTTIQHNFSKAMIRTLYQFCLKLNESDKQDQSEKHLGHDLPQELSEVVFFLNVKHAVILNF